MKKSKKGSTLVELCIVLAMSVIVFAMVGSFAMLVHYRSVVYQAQLDTTRQLESARSKVSAFLSEHDLSSDDYFITIWVYHEEENENDEIDKITYGYDTLSGSDLIENYSQIIGVTFDAIYDDENADTNNALIKMTVEYTMPISQNKSDTRTIVYVFMTYVATVLKYPPT